MVLGSNPGTGKNFSLLQNIHTGSVANPASSSVGTGGPLSVVRDVDNSTTAEVKNEWSYTSVHPMCLCDVDRNNFIYFYSAKNVRNHI